jgi:cytochrome o ubiquinol oxidase subunit 2
VSKHKKRKGPAAILARMLICFAAYGLLIFSLLKGKNVALLNPSGAIASQQRDILIFVAVVVLAVALPTVLVLYFMAWRYRDSNSKSTYHSEAKRGKIFEVWIWAFPTLIMLLLAVVLVPVTHKLQPNKALVSDNKTLNIQVVAMRWKWLFIYPDQNIASVNFVQIPKDTPVAFDLTADDAPMSSFWVPNLSGQLYAMTGHVNQLNLIANKTGDFGGRSAEINGAGFEGMKFTARVTSSDDFNTWVHDTKRSSTILDENSYSDLLKPSQNNPVQYFAYVDSSLFNAAIDKYMGSHAGHHDTSQSAVTGGQ